MCLSTDYYLYFYGGGDTQYFYADDSRLPYSEAILVTHSTENVQYNREVCISGKVHITGFPYISTSLVITRKNKGDVTDVVEVYYISAGQEDIWWDFKVSTYADPVIYFEIVATSERLAPDSFGDVALDGLRIDYATCPAGITNFLLILVYTT